MSDTGSVRVGVWGVGSHVRRNLLPALASSTAADLVALHTRNAGVLNEVATETGATAYADVDQMLASDEIDAVLVAVPTGLHASAAGAVIDNGKHVWCEKPMTTSRDETEAVIDAASAAGVVAMEADMFLHHPQFVELKEIFGSGDLGTVVSMTGRFGFPHRPGSDFRYSRALGGGALLDAGFYPIAAAVALLGPGLEVRGASIIHDQDRDIDTGGTALVASGGRSAVLDWGFGRAYRSEIEVWGENGTMLATRSYAKPSDLEPEIHIRYQTGEERTVVVDAADHFALMFDRFADVSADRTPFDPTETLERARLLTEIRTSGT